LTVGTDNTNTTYAGFFTQRAAGLTAQFIKTGTGTLTLSGNVAQNAPSGGTQGFRGVVTIQQGTLLANATAGATGGIAHSSTGRGTVTVQNGATLGGTGAVVPTLGSQAANVIAINSGGTVAPGNGGTNIGTLRFGYDDGTVVSRSTVNMNGRLLIDLTTVSNDQLAIRGALNLSGTSVLEASGITSVPGGGSTLTFTIATFDSLSGTFNPANLILPTGSTVQYNANSIQLLVPVPEPGSMIVMGMSAIGASAGWRRWRRRAI
jgi:hypothetical protein